ncbi:Ribonuclease 3 [Termitomyces sp. J132]|nr:Ribonuclease 3 [Termitomyces sp. J132]
MSSSTRTRRASLAAYLSSPTVPVSLPSLSFTDVQQALNAQKYTPGNNDVLEFIGDRVVNLACALMASKINHSPDQQTLFARRLSNNDTLGRIAHQLRLPQHASVRFDSADRCAVEAWSRCKLGSPPKLFADLFESYMGALFLRHGWHYAHAWLKKVYEPLIAAAARDAFSTTEVAPLLWSVPDAPPWPEQTQWAFEDFIDEREAEMREAIKVAMQSLPRSEVSSRREEVGMQLLKLWICELAFGVYPEIQSARDRGAHFLSRITNALMSDDTLGHLGLILSLSSYLSPSDPDFLVAYPILGSIEDKDAGENIARVKPKIASILKALTGAFYLRHPTRARKWGHKWLRPLVCWTMGILLRAGRRVSLLDVCVSTDVMTSFLFLYSVWCSSNCPIIGPSPLASPSPEPIPSAKAESSKSDTVVDALLETFDHLAIDSNPKKTHEKTSLKTSNEPQRNKIKTKKCTIKINAPWLFGSDEDNDEKLQLDLDIALDPYKLLDEGDTFPAPEPEKNAPDQDEGGDEKENTTSNNLKHPEDARTRQATDPTFEYSDGSQDMEFSSSSSGTESDMEFSSEKISSEEDVSEAQTSANVEKRKDEKKNKDEGGEDGLTKALECLEINPSRTETERSTGDSTTPATCSEGSSSLSSEPSNPLDLSKSAEIGKEEQECDAEPTAEEDELEDMEFSSSEQSNVEDGGEKDMEFSSDEDKEPSDTSNKVVKDGVPSATTMPASKSKEEHIHDAPIPSEGSHSSRTPSKVKKVRVPLSPLSLVSNGVRIKQRAKSSS